MKNITDFDTPNTPLWVMDISPDTQTGIARKVEASALSINSNDIHLPCLVYFVDVNGVKFEGERFKPATAHLICYNNSNGPFVDPLTGERIEPIRHEIKDQEDIIIEVIEQAVPDNSITRYQGLISMLNNPIVLETLVFGFIVSADANGEFDV